jgi:hypothetical protein
MRRTTVLAQRVRINILNLVKNIGGVLIGSVFFTAEAQGRKEGAKDYDECGGK